MRNQFELVGGSVVGREHLRVGKNNQDAYSWSFTEAELMASEVSESLIAVVCDGCGSGLHSEVGAKLGARMVVRTIQSVLRQGLDLTEDETWQIIQQTMLAQMQQVVEYLGGDSWEGAPSRNRCQIVQDYLLFTIAGVVITPTITAVFALGDGVIAVNHQVMQLGPFANNAPPYLGYGLLEPQLASQASPLKVLQVLPTDRLESLLIGSDGVSDLMQVAQHPLPGRSELVGDIAQFWQDDRYFRNPDQVRRRLALINRDVTHRDVTNLNQPSQCQAPQYIRQSGLLPDDTTLVVIRRKENLC